MEISIAPAHEINWFRPAKIKTLEEMKDLLLANNFSPAIFKDGYRSLANFEKAYCIGLDIDNDGKLYRKKPTPLMTLDEAKEAFKDFTHLILPSRSHQKPKDGEPPCDRFRVILFFSEPVTDLDTFYATWHWCKDKWPAIDHQCKDPSRFYYKHSDVASVRGKGLRISPVPPAPKEGPDIDSIDLSALPPGSRGKLSKTTLDQLASGIEKGNRNPETFKIAKDFQQNLFTEEEAISQIVTALRETDTIARDFTEEEVIRTIHSAYNQDPKHAPRIKPKAFNMVRIGEIYKTDVKMEWVVDRLLSVGGISLISADPKAGKSTIVRQLIASVIQGRAFLDRVTRKGVVQYFAIEEQMEVIKETFQQLGVAGESDLWVHVGDPIADTDVMADFRELLMATRPVIAVIDTMFDLIEVESENNYREVKREMRKLRKIARESGTHIVLIHHNSKGSREDRRRGNRGILGSQAIAGGVDTIAIIEVEGRKRLITTSGRGIRRWENREIVYHEKDGTYTLGPEQDEF